MILYTQGLSGARKQYVINSFSDLDELIAAFPAVKEIALFSHSIEEAVQGAAEYLSGHHMDAWVDDRSDVTKSIKNALGAIGMAAAMAMTPTSTGADAASPDMKPLEQREAASFKPFGHAKEDKFLHNVMQLESAGGKNTGHEKVKHGLLRGEKAMGRWGLMPSTVNEVLTRLDRIGKMHPSMRPLSSMDRDQRDAFFKKKPHVELELARFLARHVMARSKGDLLRAAYSWNNGHNLAPHEIDDGELESSSYVKDFAALAQGKSVRGLKPMQMVRSPAGQKVNKAEVDFSTRLKGWKRVRDEQKRQNPTITTRTANTEDLGTTRDPELDRKRSTGAAGKLIEAVRDANRKP